MSMTVLTEIAVQTCVCVWYLLDSNIRGQHLWTLLRHTFIQHCREQHQSILSLHKNNIVLSHFCILPTSDLSGFSLMISYLFPDSCLFTICIDDKAIEKPFALLHLIYCVYEAETLWWICIQSLQLRFLIRVVFLAFTACNKTLFVHK